MNRVTLGDYGAPARYSRCAPSSRSTGQVRRLTSRPSCSTDSPKSSRAWPSGLPDVLARPLLTTSPSTAATLSAFSTSRMIRCGNASTASSTTSSVSKKVRPQKQVRFGSAPQNADLTAVTLLGPKWCTIFRCAVCSPRPIRTLRQPPSLTDPHPRSVKERIRTRLQLRRSRRKHRFVRTNLWAYCTLHRRRPWRAHGRQGYVCNCTRANTVISSSR